MKKMLASNAFAVATGLLFAIGLIAYLYLFVPPFSEYFVVITQRGLRAIGPHIALAPSGELEIPVDTSLTDLSSTPGATPAQAPASFALLCFTILMFALYCLSVWLGATRLKAYRLHTIDYYFTLVFSVLALALIALLFLFFRYQWLAHIVFMVSSLTLLMNLWTTTLVRLHGNTLLATLYWTKVFKTLPLHTFSGVFVLVSVGIATLVFLFNGIRLLYNAYEYAYYVDLSVLDYLRDFFLGLCIPVFITAVIAILCRDILSVTEAKEREALDRLRSERLRIELITNVTHDIRTPLTSIINYIDLMQKPNTSNVEMAQYIDIVNRKSGQLKNLVSDLLDASKAGSGTIRIDATSIDLVELVGQVAGDFDEAMRTANLEYVNPHTDSRILITADGIHLWRVLENLFSNAVKYAMPGSRIYVDITEELGAVALTLKNVSREKLNITPEELTNQFVRGDQARQTEGSGLGLYIAERLTVMMGGSFAILIDGDYFEVRLSLPRSVSLLEE
ncbi:MAG: HAMP domain-containing histidine kinase [Coriobacteriales bacterium]|jgi:signal transduction histidine kinase|nr:HAMP domain-containing histidine kinase [Coriobacteriales bacterium]